MSNARRLNGHILQRPTNFSHWLIATASLSLAELVEILSEPHYTENDPSKTAGGSEDHWAFEFQDGMRIGILFRRAYEEVCFFSDPPDLNTALDKLEPLLKNHDIRIAEKPLLIE